jgi:hypothetical protein
MTPDYALDETDRALPSDVGRRVLLTGDDTGQWTLAGLGSGARQFSDFEAALDDARQAPDTRMATIEVWQDSQYICCLPPSAWRPHGASIRSAPAVPQGRLLTTVERQANRAAQILLTTAGPLFWLALVVVAISASLGWRLFLL